MSDGVADTIAGEDVVVESRSAASASEGSLTELLLGPDLAPGEDVGSVLDGAPGTTVRRLGGLGDFTGISIRGSSFRQVEVYLDEIPLNPDGSHAVDLSELPAVAFDKVVLYRGYAPPWFGSSAMGGVVDLVTPTDPRTAVGGAAGSWETAHVWAVAGGEAGPVDSLLVIDHLHTEGNFLYFDDQGTEFNLFDDRTLVRENNALDRSTALARTRVDLGPATLTALDQLSRGFRELPGTMSSPSTEATWANARNLLSVGLTPPSSWRVRLDPRAWWLWRTETIDDRAGEIGVGPTWMRDTFHTVGVDLPVGWYPPGMLAVSGLVRARQETFRPYDLLLDEGDGTRSRTAVTANVGGLLHAWDERLLARAVLQGEVLDNRFLGEVPFEAMPVAPEGEAVDAHLLPRAGLVLRPIDALSLRANAGWYQRPPDFVELFGNQGVIVGNTDLVPERGTSVEVGAHAEVGLGRGFGFAIDAAYARSRVHDLIAYEPNSQQTEHAVNVGEAYVRALEGGLVLCAGDWIDTSTSVTSTLSRNLLPDAVYANNQLPNVPPLEVGHSTHLRLGRYLELGHSWSFTAATYADAANATLYAPRSLHSVSAAVHPAPGLPSVRAEVLNLLDVRGMAVDRNPYSDEDDTLVVKPLTDFAGYPLPGRTVMVAVTWEEPPKDPP